MEAGAAAVEDWIKAVGWDGPFVNTNKWLVSGHSNGGNPKHWAHCWDTNTYNSKVKVPGMPLRIDLTKFSGLLRSLATRPYKVSNPMLNVFLRLDLTLHVIEYVPYQLWIEADTRVTSVIQKALQSYRHELLVRNFESIRVIQQHGSADDNVPAYHSRRMNQLILQSNSTKSSSYVELKGKGHWFDGVMSTPQLRDFYADILDLKAEMPALPQTFSIAIANPADMGPRGGLKVDQLNIPGQLGIIDVSRNASMWTMTTSNIRRFHIERDSSAIPTLKLAIDDDCLVLTRGEEASDLSLVRTGSGHWQVSNLDRIQSTS